MLHTRICPLYRSTEWVTCTFRSHPVIMILYIPHFSLQDRCLCIDFSVSGIPGSYIFSCSVTIYSLNSVAPDNLMFFYEKLFTFKKFFQIIYKCLSSNLIYKSNTYFRHLLITLANSLNPDQDQQIVRPDLDPNCLKILIAFNK